MQQEEKKIIFITDRTDHDKIIYSSTKIEVTKNPCQLDEWLQKTRFAGFDVESNGKRLFISNLLLISIGDYDTQFVIDATSGVLELCRDIINKHADHITFFGHNLGFDFNLGYCHGIYLQKVFDTLIAERRIHMGKTDMYGQMDYASCVARYLKVHLDKGTREDFMKMNKTSKFHVTHIVYSANDIRYIILLARAQREILRSYGQYDWFNVVENELTVTLGEMEIEGIKCYEGKWTNIIQTKIKQIKEQEIKLNNEVVKHYRETQPQLLATNLFGEATLVENHKKAINFNSGQQVLEIIARVTGGVVPMFKEKAEAEKASAREVAIQQFLIDNPQTPLRKFLEEYLTYKEYKTFVSRYGEKFLKSEIRKKGDVELGFLNPITKRVHTSYKQMHTDTGRLASGDKDNGYYNSQNIPKEKQVREGFGLTEEEIAAGYWLTTCDLSGAEATIMAAFADEQYMYQLAIVDDDVHSPIATACWQAVAKYRMVNGRDLTVKDSQHTKYTLTEDFLINKGQNKGLRTDFKNFTFGAIYGMKPTKGAQTLNIPKDEAEIMIKTIKGKFPKVFKMVEEAEQCAFADGYVILNNRSNNRRWFTEVLDMHKQLDISDRTKRYWTTRQEIKFKDMMEISGAARNVRIQGTQADMIKESMVVLRRKFVELTKKHSDMGNVVWQYLPNRWGQQKLSVHDELVVKHKSKEFGNDIAQIMTETANLYLAPYSANIRMKADYHTLTHWTK